MPDSTAVTTGQFYESPVPGVVQVIKASYTATAELAANSVLRMVPVKKGAKIVDMKVKFTALGTGVTIDIGDGDDVDRFLDGGNAAAAGALQCLAPAGVFHAYTADDTIDITILGAVMPADAVIDLVVSYTMNQ